MGVHTFLPILNGPLRTKDCLKGDATLHCPTDVSKCDREAVPHHPETSRAFILILADHGSNFIGQRMPRETVGEYAKRCLEHRSLDCEVERRANFSRKQSTRTTLTATFLIDCDDHFERGAAR